MIRRLVMVVLVSTLAGCANAAMPSEGASPVLHPNLDDALSQSFGLLVGHAPFTVRLWVENAEGFTARWDSDGDGVADATGLGAQPVRFTVPGVYEPSVTLSAAGRPRVTLHQRIVVLGDDPVVPPGRYGVNQDLAWDPPQQIPSEISLMKAAGVEWLRLPLRWSWIEPQRGQYRWDRVDGVIHQADEAGLELLAVLGGTPRWSSGLDGTAGRVERWDTFEPSDSRDFAAYVYRLVDRFQGRVAAYELLNEPNSPNHWSPRPNAARFVELLCAGYLAAKYADPSAAVVAGGLNGNGLSLGWESPDSRDFLRSIYAGPGARCFDVMAIHPFAHPTQDGVAGAQRWIDEARSYMDRQGDRRELWLTEIGWSTGTELWGHPTITEEQQADWVRAVYRDIDGPRKLFWYNFKEIRPDPTDPEYQWGWLRYDLRPKPAYRAFADLTKQ